MEELGELSEEELEELYTWVDTIPLSRPKRNITRDFSDGVLVSEVVKHYHPKLVDLHNFTATNSVSQKKQNWSLLNRKVFSRMRFQLTDDVIHNICSCKPGIIEKVLMMLRVKISQATYEMQKTKNPPGRNSRLSNDKPEADQNIGGSLSPVRQGPAKQYASVPAVAHAGPYKGTKTKALHETDYVPRILLEEKEQENLAKEETIQILQAKVKRLEHLIHLKDIRIEDLQGRLEASRPTGKR